MLYIYIYSNIVPEVCLTAYASSEAKIFAYLELPSNRHTIASSRLKRTNYLGENLISFTHSKIKSHVRSMNQSSLELT